VVGLTDRFKMAPDKRGLYMPNPTPSAPAIPVRTAPRLVAISGGR
jgi:hypothetical protein